MVLRRADPPALQDPENFSSRTSTGLSLGEEPFPDEPFPDEPFPDEPFPEEPLLEEPLLEGPHLEVFSARQGGAATQSSSEKL